jgi:hypothetical protein
MKEAECRARATPLEYETDEFGQVCRMIALAYFPLFGMVGTLSIESDRP